MFPKVTPQPGRPPVRRGHGRAPLRRYRWSLSPQQNAEADPKNHDVGKLNSTNRAQFDDLGTRGLPILSKHATIQGVVVGPGFYPSPNHGGFKPAALAVGQISPTRKNAWNPATPSLWQPTLRSSNMIWKIPHLIHVFPIETSILIDFQALMFKGDPYQHFVNTIKHYQAPSTTILSP